jgi:hypothetical protein
MITSGLRKNTASARRDSLGADSWVKEIVEDVNDEIHSNIDERNHNADAHDRGKVL